MPFFKKKTLLWKNPVFRYALYNNGKPSNLWGNLARMAKRELFLGIVRCILFSFFFACPKVPMIDFSRMPAFFLFCILYLNMYTKYNVSKKLYFLCFFYMSYFNIFQALWAQRFPLARIQCILFLYIGKNNFLLKNE